MPSRATCEGGRVVALIRAAPATAMNSANVAMAIRLLSSGAKVGAPKVRAR